VPTVQLKKWLEEGLGEGKVKGLMEGERNHFVV
jgi:hypothetical protein